MVVTRKGGCRTDTMRAQLAYIVALLCVLIAVRQWRLRLRRKAVSDCRTAHACSVNMLLVTYMDIAYGVFSACVLALVVSLGLTVTGINAAALLGGAGFATGALLLSAKGLVEDLISGLMLVVDERLVLYDRVRVFTGTVWMPEEKGEYMTLTGVTPLHLEFSHRDRVLTLSPSMLKLIESERRR